MRPRNRIEVDLKSFSPRVSSFFEETIAHANDHGFGVRMIKTDRVKLSKGVYCQGYISSDDKLIQVACHSKFKRWLGVFAHEGCHLDQYVENPARWEKEDGSELVDMWLAKEVDPSPSKLWSAVKKLQKLEHDCENRTLNKILCYDLPIDFKRYVKAANAYIWFYTIVARTRRWSKPGFPPYEQSSIVKYMPDYMLDLEEYHQVNDKLIEKFSPFMQ